MASWSLMRPAGRYRVGTMRLDESLVAEMAPYVHGLLDTYASWRGPNGLICEAPSYMFMDWGRNWRPDG
jgi:hypothetical protein